MVSCPSCGSRSVKKSSAAYEQGISYGNSTSGGMYITSRGRIGYRAGKTRSQRTSAVAQRNAPPQNALPGVAAVMVFALCVAAGVSVGGGLIGPLVVGSIAAVMAGLWAGKVTSADFAARRADYERQWYCRQCGSMFRV